MQPVTVAVVDTNQKRRAQLEQLLQRGESSVEVLTDISSNYDSIKDRRLRLRQGLTLVENIVARVKRLRPRVLFANTHQFSGAYIDLLVALRHYCPDTLVVLLIDQPIDKNQILKALANGACGFLDSSADVSGFSKVVRAVDQGEAWISRKLLGEIMDKVVSACLRNPTEVNLDSTR